MLSILFLFSLANVILKIKHVIMVLMGMELMMLIIMLMITQELVMNLLSQLFISLLVLMVSESCVAMSLYVGYSQFYSFDQMLLNSSMKF